MQSRQEQSSLQYQKRIQKALAFIRENLDRPISIKDVAKAACFSEFHFHRIFSALMNETVGEYITRKRLERAAIKLAYSPQLKVTNIAFEYGYSSVSSFSKSFHQWFGCRPTEISKIKDCLDSGQGKLQTKYEKSIEGAELFVGLEDQDGTNKFKEIDTRVKVQTIPEFKVYYLTSRNGYDYSSIKKTWSELLERCEDAAIDLKQCERFAISHDHPGLTPASLCRYDACIAIPKDVERTLNLACTVIPAGRYAVFSVTGPEDSILSQYLEFYTVWMPQSGYEPANFPVVEHYVGPFQEELLSVELWAQVNRLSFI